MKTFIIKIIKSTLFCILFFFSNNSLNAQRGTVLGTPRGERPIKYNELAIMKPGDISKGITYGDTTNKVIALLGNPNSIEESFNEIYRANEKIYLYKKNKIYIIDNKVISYSLFDNTLAFGKLNKFQIRVNQEIIRKNRKQYIGDFEVTTNRSRVPQKGMNVEYTSHVRNSGLLNIKNEIIDDAGFEVLIKNNKVVFIHLGEY